MATNAPPAPTETPETAAAPAPAEITTGQNKITTLKSYLEQPKVKAGLKEVMPSFMTPDRMLRIAIAAASRTPAILECTPQSILKSLMLGAQLGLEVGSATGSAYLVPFKNNRKVKNKDGSTYWETVMEAQFIAGYRGLIDLARRSGQVSTIAAYIVHEKEVETGRFDIDYGRTAQPVTHRPILVGERGPMIGVWAIAVLSDGGVQVDFMTKADVELIRLRSRAKDSGPWQTDYDEMSRKTIVRRICKYLPLSVERAKGLITALAAENRAEGAESQNDLIELDLSKVGISDEETEPAPAAALSAPGTATEIPQRKEDKMAEQLAARRASKPAAASTPAPAATTPPAAPDAPPVTTQPPAAEKEPEQKEPEGPDGLYERLLDKYRKATSLPEVENYEKIHAGTISSLPADLQAQFVEQVASLKKAFKTAADAKKKKKTDAPAPAPAPAATEPPAQLGFEDTKAAEPADVPPSSEEEGY